MPGCSITSYIRKGNGIETSVKEKLIIDSNRRIESLSELSSAKRRITGFRNILESNLQVIEAVERQMSLSYVKPNVPESNPGLAGSTKVLRSGQQPGILISVKMIGLIFIVCIPSKGLPGKIE